MSNISGIIDEILMEELSVKSSFLSQKGIPLGFVEFKPLFALNASQKKIISLACIPLWDIATRFSNSGFFHELVSAKPLSNPLGPF
jgi:hypothetical protein